MAEKLFCKLENEKTNGNSSKTLAFLLRKKKYWKKYIERHFYRPSNYRKT